MEIRRVVFAMVAALITSTAYLHAQQSGVRSDSARTQIQSILRAFYFNLTNHDWEALTADILAAKVVAHRPAPEALVIAGNTPRRQSPGGSGGSSSPAVAPVECSSTAAAEVDRATLVLDGDWAEVSVPRCTAGGSGIDEFRLIDFELRWRIVYIDLFEEPMKAGVAAN
jgi:hypothetical protein